MTERLPSDLLIKPSWRRLISIWRCSFSSLHSPSPLDWAPSLGFLLESFFQHMQGGDNQINTICLFLDFLQNHLPSRHIYSGMYASQVPQLTRGSGTWLHVCPIKISSPGLWLLGSPPSVASPQYSLPTSASSSSSRPSKGVGKCCKEIGRHVKITEA